MKFWGLGNEIEGPWQLGHKNAEDYAKLALEAAKAMRRQDAAIKLIASGSSNFRPDADWIGWNRTVLERLKAFIRHADIVKMANLAQLVNVVAPIFTNRQGLFRQTIYFPLLEYGRQRGNLSLDLLVSSPTYRAGRRPPLSYLDVSGTYSAKDRYVYLNVLNRSEETDITTRIDNVTGQLASEAAAWEMSHPDLKATNDFGSEKILPISRTAALPVANNGFTYTFPKHSLTILRLKVQ